MTTNKHPYVDLPPSRYWRTAVTDAGSSGIDLQWAPKSPIARETGILTAGSCFAQHISRSLRKNGFRWIDSEPAPAEMPQADHAANGYGIFSFRTGNIYTAALLRQWISWATGRAEQSRESFLERDRVYDPFRPSLTADGFPSVEEMLAARTTTLACMLEALKKARLFVFTLGLTEAWRNRDGTVYPMCPGTIQGQFSPDDHMFHNYSEQEVLRDLDETLDWLLQLNPALRFLLTVSPVPLTATASGQHVVTATTYSKSALRSAAGYLCQVREEVDYFPSYELITAPAFKGAFFEPNMRTVAAAGVEFVMGHFLRGIGANGVPTESDDSASRNVADTNAAGARKAGSDICDEIILETWANKPIGRRDANADILLVGDSHMGMIANVLDELGVGYAGGAIMNRSEWHLVRFDVDDETVFAPHNAESNARWEGICQANLAKGMSDSRRPWVLTNVGIHTSLSVSDHGLFGYLKQQHGGTMPDKIQGGELESYLLLSRRVHLGVLCGFLARGYQVLVVTDPPSEPYFHGLFEATDRMLVDLYRSIGCRVFSARDWIQSLGGMPDDFKSTETYDETGQLDWVHGSREYYRRLVQEVSRQFPINLIQRDATRMEDSRESRQDTDASAPSAKSNGPSFAEVALSGEGAPSDVCDDIILGTWSGEPADELAQPPNVLLIGDSQMGMIAKALDDRGIFYGGGAIMNGSDWHASLFTPLDQPPYFIPLDGDARKRWEQASASVLSRYRGSDCSRLWIITNIGFHSSSIFTPIGIAAWYRTAYGKEVGLGDTMSLTEADVVNYLHHARQSHFSLLRRLTAAGYRLIWVSDPPVNPVTEPLAGLAEAVLTKMLKAIGCPVFSSREWVRTIGGMRDELVSDEVHEKSGIKVLAHGSAEYYRRLAGELLRKFPIQPRYRNTA